MGIRGLTTFIQNRSHLYMEKYELHDGNLVIDGNSVACQLYHWHCSSNDCFGGDYDKFGQVILKFFQLLFDCNITPYVVFDGGYESRKVATVISRMKNKIRSAEQLDSVTEGSVSVFPLFLRDVFEEIVRKLKMKAVRCDFEGDTDTASIARTLKCPVLSYDSDYFILDVEYIPFNTFEMNVKYLKNNETKTVGKYVSCQIYRVEKFLSAYGGLNKSNLPILAVLLGNDYVQRKVFALFFQNLKMQKTHGNEQQKRIKSLIVWLQNETNESALKVILNRYKKINRPKVLKKIQNAIRGYFNVNSKYLEYLGIKTLEEHNVNDLGIDFHHLLSGSSDNAVQDSDDNAVQDSDDESSPLEEDSALSCDEIELSNILEVENDSTTLTNVPTDFLHNFRKCIYPPCFMDILTRNQYYCIPQVENSTLEFAHSISLSILSAIHKIITNSTQNLICVCRVEKWVSRQKIPIFHEVPLYSEICDMPIEDRINLFFKILGINNFHTDCVNIFPKTWQVFLLSLLYFMEKSACTWPLILSLVLVKVVLDYIDKKIGGFYRNRKQFHKFFEKTKLSQNIEDYHSENILTALDHISYNDSVNALKNLIIYFEMDEKMRSHRKSFDRNLVHHLAQFQSVLLHVTYLNRLLGFPFNNMLISDTLNCTFVYNFVVNLRKRTNCEHYIEFLLKDSPTVLSCFKMITNLLKDYFPEKNFTENIKKKRRKKKLRSTNINHSDLSLEEEEEEEEECSFDPNNKFSLLSSGVTRKVQ